MISPRLKEPSAELNLMSRSQFTTSYWKMRWFHPFTVLLIVMCAPGNLVFSADASRSLESENASALLKDPAQLQVPHELGTIVKSWRPVNQQPKGLVIYLQDAHTQLGVQHNLSRLIGYLRSRFGISVVGVEGADGTCMADWYAGLLKPEGREAIADALLEEVVLTGAEHYAITHPYQVRLVGIEDEHVYQENLSIYRKGSPKVAQAQVYLRRLEEIIEAQAEAVYPAQVTAIRKARLAFEAKDAKADGLLRGYLAELVSAADALRMDISGHTHALILHKMLEFDQDWNQEGFSAEHSRLLQALFAQLPEKDKQRLVQLQAALRERNISNNDYFHRVAELTDASGVAPDSYPMLRRYLGSLEDRSGINLVNALDQIRLIEDAVYSKALLTERQRALWDLEKRANWIHRLVELKATSHDLANAPEGNDLHAIIDDLKSLGMESVITLSELEEGLSILSLRRDFYRLARERDGALGRKSIALFEPQIDPKPIVVLTGGFHARGLEEVWQQANLAYIVVVPRVDGQTNIKGYHARLMGYWPSADDIQKRLRNNNALVTPLIVSADRFDHVAPAFLTLVRAQSAGQDALFTQFKRVMLAGKKALMRSALGFASPSDPVVIADLRRSIGLDPRIRFGGLDIDPISQTDKDALEQFRNRMRSAGQVHLAKLIDAMLELNADSRFSELPIPKNVQAIMAMPEIKRGADSLKPRVAVIGGAGHVGLPMSVAYAIKGHQITSYDADAAKIKGLNAEPKVMPFFDQTAEEKLRDAEVAARLTFADPESMPLETLVENHNVLLMALPTPDNGDGADLSVIEDIAGRIAEAAYRIATRAGGQSEVYKLIVIKSTVPPGTSERLSHLVDEKLKGLSTQQSQPIHTAITIEFASNPEFLREPTALQDALQPNRTVVGVKSIRAAQLMYALYRPFFEDETDFEKQLIVTTPRTAETAKYMANSWLGFKLGVMSAASQIAEAHGVDFDELRAELGKEETIGATYMITGLGGDGPCLPKDINAIKNESARAGIDAGARFFEAVWDLNVGQWKHQAKRVFDQVRGEEADLKGKIIAVLGIVFSAGTDDVKFAAPVEVIFDLLNRGAGLRIYDPEAKKEDFERELARVAAVYLGAEAAGAQMHDLLRRIHYIVRSSGDADAIVEAATGSDAAVILAGWRQFVDIDLEVLKGVMRQPVLFNFAWDQQLRHAPFALQAEESGFIYEAVGKTRGGLDRVHEVDRIRRILIDLVGVSPSV